MPLNDEERAARNYAAGYAAVLKTWEAERDRYATERAKELFDDYISTLRAGFLEKAKAEFPDVAFEGSLPRSRPTIERYVSGYIGRTVAGPAHVESILTTIERLRDEGKIPNE